MYAFKISDCADVLFIGTPGQPYQPIGSMYCIHIIVLDLCLRCERISVARVSESSHPSSLSLS